MMKTEALNFNDIVEKVYDLPLEERIELKDLLNRNIADTRRSEIAGNFKKSKAEHQTGKLHFSSKIDELKKMI